MILKVKQKDGYITICDIREVDFKYEDKYVLAYGGSFPSPHMMVYRKGNCNEDDSVSCINRNSLGCFDQFLFTEDVLLNQIHQTEKPEDSESKDKYWSYNCIRVRYRDGTIEYLLALQHQIVYLLNDDGKTIDKY